jgi:hypothetical protein
MLFIERFVQFWRVHASEQFAISIFLAHGPFHLVDLGTHQDHRWSRVLEATQGFDGYHPDRIINDIVAELAECSGEVRKERSGNQVKGWHLASKKGESASAPEVGVVVLRMDSGLVSPL